MFRTPLIIYAANYSQPEAFADMPPDVFRAKAAATRRGEPPRDGRHGPRLGAAAILGVERWHFSAGGLQFFNAAACIDREGRFQAHYDKMHPVMFGEYVPLADRFPWLQRLTPLGDNLTAGEEPAMFTVGKLRVAPNICFENVLSHLIRGQVNRLRAARPPPNVLVSLTNDGWFWGSSELDMHLACAAFRAVECRMPLLIAANTGFSAWIDGDGRIRAQGPRRAAEVVFAEVRADPRAAYTWILATGSPAVALRRALGWARSE